MAISVENRKFSHPVYFEPTLKGFSLELVIGAGGKNWNDGAAGLRKKFDDIFSHLDTIHERDRRTDTGRQKRPHLHA